MWAGWGGVLFLRAEAGVCARRRSNFLLPRQKKVTKEKATLQAASLRCAAGNLRCSRPAGSRSNSLHCVALRQSRALIRWPLRSSAHPEGNPGCGHPHGPLLRCAALGPLSRAQAPRAAQPGPSEAMARWLFGCWMFGCPTPCWLRLRRGGCGVSMGVEAPMLRALTRRGCPSGARSAKRVPRRTPQPTRRRFAPERSAGVADWGSPFFCLLFFGEAKKSESPAGATTRPPPQTQACSKDQHTKASTSSARTVYEPHELRQTRPTRTDGNHYKNNSYQGITSRR